LNLGRAELRLAARTAVGLRAAISQEVPAAIFDALDDDPERAKVQHELHQQNVRLSKPCPSQ
jgi:hypothetical protein